MSVILLPMFGAVLKNPTMTPLNRPVGPFMFSIHPGSGSDFVHATITVFYTYYLYFYKTTFLFLLIEGRNIDIGKRFSFVNIMFSVTAFVKVYVFGQSSIMLSSA